jgi:hypothetical protein
MPSEPHSRRRWSWSWLSSQGLGVICGQATVVLLALGSVVLTATRDGASARIAMDDVRGFFAAPAAAHLWFYLLLPVLALYALNTLLATWQSVVRKWRNGIRAPQLYAPAVIHLAFLFGLLAHAVGGLLGSEGGNVLVGPDWRELGDGRRARVTSFDVEPHPNGSMKQLRAQLEIEAADTTTTETVSYNGPLSRGLGSDLLILTRPQSVPAVQLTRGEARCDLEVEGSCDLGGVRAELLYLQPPARRGQLPYARVGVSLPSGKHAKDGAGGPSEVFWLPPGQSKQLADGSFVSVASIEMRPALLLRQRHAPGNPWALLASILLALGLAMMWRRFLPGASRASP